VDQTPRNGKRDNRFFTTKGRKDTKGPKKRLLPKDEILVTRRKSRNRRNAENAAALAAEVAFCGKLIAES